MWLLIVSMFEDVTDHPTILGVAIIVFILTFAVNGGGGKSRPFPVSDSFFSDHTGKHSLMNL